MRIRYLFVLMMFAAVAFCAEKYDGPRPPKPDVLYLVHADNLVPTEVAEAKQESRKNDISFTIAGSNSPARTPLAEPIFIMEADKISPERLELYRVDVKNGHREVTMSQKRTRGGPRPLRLSVTRLDKGLYRIEASETLENGQ